MPGLFYYDNNGKSVGGQRPPMPRVIDEFKRIGGRLIARDCREAMPPPLPAAVVCRSNAELFHRA